jgi:WD40 repeat protein
MQAGQSWVDTFTLGSQTSLSKSVGSMAVFSKGSSGSTTGAVAGAGSGSSSASRLAVFRDWCVNVGGSVEVRHACSLLIRDVVTGKTLTEIKQANAKPLAWSADGRWIAAGETSSGCSCGSSAGGDRVGVWDARTGARVGRVIGHIDDIVHAAFTPSRALVTLSRDATLRVTDPATCRTVARLELAEQRGRPLALALSPDGRAVVAVWGAAVHLWLPETGHLTSYALAAVRRAEGWPLCVSPDARYLACRTEEGFDIMEVASGAVVCEVSCEGIATAAAFSEDGKVLLLGKMDGIVEVWDIRDASA